MILDVVRQFIDALVVDKRAGRERRGLYALDLIGSASRLRSRHPRMCQSVK